MVNLCLSCDGEHDMVTGDPDGICVINLDLYHVHTTAYITIHPGRHVT